MLTDQTLMSAFFHIVSSVSVFKRNYTNVRVHTVVFVNDVLKQTPFENLESSKWQLEIFSMKLGRKINVSVQITFKAKTYLSTLKRYEFTNKHITYHVSQKKK